MSIGKTSAGGSFHLFVGKTVSTVILAVGTIILGAMIAEADYGLYTIALIPSTTFLLFQDWGVGSAVTRRCAQYRAQGKEAELRRTVVNGLIFELATAVALMLLSVLMANILAATVFGKPESASLLVFASINILSIAVFNFTQSVFVGYEKMKTISLVLICQAVVQSSIAPILVYLGLGTWGALIGYVSATVAGSAISIGLLYFVILKGAKTSGPSVDGVRKAVKSLLNYGVPFALANILSGGLGQFYSFMMASYITDLTLIGNYKVATNFVALLGFFSVPIVMVLFPAFSKLDPQKESQLVKITFASSVKYGSLLMMPATMIMMVLAGPIIGTLYGDKWPVASTFLALSVISNLLAIFGSLSLNGFLLALGETKQVLKMNIVTLAIGVPTAFLLIPWLGIPGVILGLLAAGVPSLFVGLHFVWKKYGVKIDASSSARILLASALAACAVYSFTYLVAISPLLELIMGTVLFAAVYLVTLPLVGAIRQVDISNLRTMFSGLFMISKILEILFGMLEIPLRIASRRGKQGK